MLIWRLILGIGMGCKAAVVPVFAAEIAPPHLRGLRLSNSLSLRGFADRHRLFGDELASI